ncbi:hypothetical protein BOW68_10495 [Enterococcus faecium]|uniref:ATP-binding cassette domain-containing protein n=7 Tax=Bacteria TaxID=2 RepID=UPI0002A465D0|nr:Arginine transport ATP-binding protein ArtM [Enterococcus faecium]ELB13761.1 hypothetical protein OIK_03137 [Enterococcus faecium EnGen0027]EOI59108.1 hypothetical protein UKA_00350 [Enterococcus faecium EnGen0322]EOL77920.1 hypothetical protein UK9_00316 [Enterococcus faecium EnGen0320]EOM35954.1 hypothetical protein U9I_00442 [Enterococcus faecium EnGen0255]EXG73607.1 hypothetical protein EFXG_03820 [Enterococcus faecium C68]
MAEIVKVTHLKKSFGRFEALKDVSFTVHSGEVVGFIGPNGSGKSTTIRTLLGIIICQIKRDKTFHLRNSKKLLMVFGNLVIF